MPPLQQRLLLIDGPRHAHFHAQTLPKPGPADILVRPLVSSFKHGTEMMAYSGASPFASRRFNPVLRLFEDRPETEPFYPRPMGSMTVGVVEWAGAQAGDVRPGDCVYAWAPIADRHLLPAQAAAPLGRLTPEEALCIDPASFALGAVIDGAIAASETVLVTGLGAIGLFAVQYCVALGAKVIAASSFEKRRALAARFGAAEIYDPAAEPDIARAIKEKTGGADAAIECSGNPGTLNQAIRAMRQCGRVVCVGFYPAADSRLRLGEEFFHNRINLLASLPALSWNNPVRGEQPLYAKDLQARAAADFMSKKITPGGILDPILSFEHAEAAVELIAGAPEKTVKIMLDHAGG